MHIVREAKNRWLSKKAEEAQRERFSGKRVWKCIRDMQYCRRGLIPTRCITIKEESRVPCTTTETQERRWREHFNQVLNMRSGYNEEELVKVKQRPIRIEMAEEPTMKELPDAVS